MKISQTTLLEVMERRHARRPARTYRVDLALLLAAALALILDFLLWGPPPTW